MMMQAGESGFIVFRVSALGLIPAYQPFSIFDTVGGEKLRQAGWNARGKLKRPNGWRAAMVR